MTLHKLVKNVIFQNLVLLESGHFRFFNPRTLPHSARSSSAVPEAEKKPEENTTGRKIIRVAILGRPNAGKSTLINRILDKTVCDVSCKTHTTKMPLKAALTVGDTQIVFVDTPGVVTKKEYKRFNLSATFMEWKKQVLNAVDLVGIIHEAPRVTETHNFSMKLMHCLYELPETTPLFLIINKIDLVKDKIKLMKASKRLLDKSPKNKLKESEAENPEDENLEEKLEKSNVKERISKIFYVSALENVGVGDVVNYLLEQAKEGEWVLPGDQHCDTSLHNLILNLTRAELMNFLPNTLPYSLKYYIELLEENELGQIACVVLVKCPKDSSKSFLLSKRLNRVKKIARKVESDLYNIFQKDFRITIVITDKKGKT